MVGCEGDASPYVAYGVIDAATQGCILRSAGETQRHKNPHSVPHEQLVPTAGLPYCPAGREAVDRTGAGFHQPRLGVYRSGTRHGSNLRGPGTRVYERGTPPPCLHGRWHREQSAAALSSTARGPPKGAARGRRGVVFHQRRSPHHETGGRQDWLRVPRKECEASSTPSRHGLLTRATSVGQTPQTGGSPEKL